MSYSFDIKTKLSFEEAVSKTKAHLAAEGFGVLTEINVKQTLRKKLDVDFRKYIILGACNPTFAYQALLAENKIGTMLPCNIIVQELESGEVEISAIDPQASMQAVDNLALTDIAAQVRRKLQKVIAHIE